MKRRIPQTMIKFFLMLLLIAFLVAFLILMPLWLPAVAVLQALDRRRLRAAAEQFRCLACGEVLGSESVRLADVANTEDWAERRRKSPDFIFRVVRRFDAICGRCGKKYRYSKQSMTFEEVALALDHNTISSPVLGDFAPSQDAVSSGR